MGYCASKSCCERAVTGTRKWGLLLWYPIRLCYVVPLSFCFAIEKNSTKQHEVHENVPFSFFHCIRYWLLTWTFKYYNRFWFRNSKGFQGFAYCLISVPYKIKLCICGLLSCNGTNPSNYQIPKRMMSSKPEEQKSLIYRHIGIVETKLKMAPEGKI